jgi:cob(I)alamin adenosyltransferase
MKSKIYTLTGDKGTTSLVGGQRVSKDDVRVEAYGTVDELNSHLGLLACCPELDYPGIVEFLHSIQNKLFNIGSYLATKSDDKSPVYGLADDDVKAIEAKIDEMSAQLPPMRGFILPGGSHVSAVCDICRTVTRRAERRVVTLAGEAYVDPVVLRYLNRLSDFFFIFARFNNISNQFEEIYWDKER